MFKKKAGEKKYVLKASLLLRKIRVAWGRKKERTPTTKSKRRKPQRPKKHKGQVRNGRRDTPQGNKKRGAADCGNNKVGGIRATGEGS